jgi:hypothetical protein
MSKYDSKFIKRHIINGNLQPCKIEIDGILHHGFLYLKTKNIVVILNAVVNKAYLGPLKNIRYEHIEPEADIHIFPRKMIKTIEFYK